MEEKAVFSKAPLKEVIFEIRFPTSISAACSRDEFYNEIRENYPTVILPKLSFEQHPFAQPSQYVNIDKTKMIICSAEAFSFSTSKYESFAVFRKESTELINMFLKKYRTINEITRIGLRFINNIRIERKDSKIDLGHYVNFNFSLPNYLDKHLLEFFQTSFFIELEKNTSGVRVSINNRHEKDDNEFLILDFDLISLKKITVGEIDKHLVEYHQKIEDIFLNIITEKYKEYIR